MLPATDPTIAEPANVGSATTKLRRSARTGIRHFRDFLGISPAPFWVARKNGLRQPEMGSRFLRNDEGLIITGVIVVSKLYNPGGMASAGSLKMRSALETDKL
jgi:hypothetical protein